MRLSREQPPGGFVGYWGFQSRWGRKDQQKANTRAAPPALTEGDIPLPPLLRLRTKSFLEGLYTGERLSVREISRLADVSRSTVLEALDRLGIPRNRDGRRRTGHLPFGFDYLNHQLVKNGAEQAAIRMMRMYRACGLSLREIAGNLNLKLIPTKQNGIWRCRACWWRMASARGRTPRVPSCTASWICSTRDTRSRR